MYNVLDSPQRMTREQIKNKFKGKWVYFAGLEKPNTVFFDSAIPVIIADKPFEGMETGIYDEFDDAYDGNTTDLSFLDNELNVFGFDEVKTDVR